MAKGKQEDEGSFRAQGVEGKASHFLPDHDEARKYYQALREKHFSEHAVGSRFLKDTLESLLQRMPDLEEGISLAQQDDRDEFTRLGITNLRPDIGYFRIPAVGVSRLLPGQSGEKVLLREAKPGFLSFVTARQNEVPEDFSTVLIGNNPHPPPIWQVITAFPGLPYEPERSGISTDNDLGFQDGQVIQLEDLERILGRKNLLLQVE